MNAGGAETSTSKEHPAFMLDPLSQLDGLAHRRMMGEYLLYRHEKLAVFLYDNRLLLKPVPSALSMMLDVVMELPSGGAKQPLLRVDQVADPDFLKELFIRITPELSEPAAKKKSFK